jgi:galactonate dehydratase
MIRIPLAAGERHHTIYEFRDLLQHGELSYVRPDVGLAGGISNCRKISTLADAFQAQVILHNAISPLLTAASVQVDLTIGNFALQEYSMSDEAGPALSLLKEPLKRDGGYLVIPHGPGLGVEINESFVTQRNT